MDDIVFFSGILTPTNEIPFRIIQREAAYHSAQLNVEHIRPAAPLDPTNCDPVYTQFHDRVYKPSRLSPREDK